jgi:hypothetical protein
VKRKVRQKARREEKVKIEERKGEKSKSKGRKVRKVRKVGKWLLRGQEGNKRQDREQEL